MKVIKDLKKNNQNKILNIKQKLNLILLYEECFEEIVNFKIKNDETIIEKAEFILYSFYLGDKSQIKNISNCLVNNSDYKNLSLINYDEFPKKWNYNELCSKNLVFCINWNNLFLDNSYYFKYPYILKRNSLMNIEEIYYSFIEFIKEIYKSDLMKEIYYNIPEFRDFLFPYEDKDILK